jgi:hypothetical protein
MYEPGTSGVNTADAAVEPVRVAAENRGTVNRHRHDRTPSSLEFVSVTGTLATMSSRLVLGSPATPDCVMTIRAADMNLL